MSVPVLTRRLLLGATALPWLGMRYALAQPQDLLPLFAAARLLIGVERLAKLRLEQALLPERALLAQRRTQQQLGDALRQLRATPARLFAALPARRLAQMQLVLDEVEAFAAKQAPAPAAELLGESEALVVRLSFVSTALSGLAADATRASQVDLFARAAGSALRVGKLNYAAALAPAQAASLRIGAVQALGEFSAALQAVGQQQLSTQQQQDLALAQQQWLLCRAVLGADGLLRERARLAELASTSDRIAESLDAMAQRAA